MAAVTTFVARRPTLRHALGFGVRWGAGHSAAILGVGAVLIVLGLQVPDGLARGLEFGVGALLLGLGLWLLWNVLHARAHAAAAIGHTHPRGHATLGVGIAHGLAGTAPLVALLPVALRGDPWQAAAYLVWFGVGTTVAMALYAVLAGVVFARATERSAALVRGLRTATALGSAVLGVVWMAGAVGA